MTTLPTQQHAWMYSVRLSGMNYKVQVERKANSIFVTDPSDSDIRFRLSAAKFDAGERQYRDGMCIVVWDELAAQRTAAEQNWQS